MALALIISGSEQGSEAARDRAGSEGEVKLKGWVETYGQKG
jgi:hypothetical protein